jgi:DNA invertase Pin-like site-specific DNA recombinase
MSPPPSVRAARRMEIDVIVVWRLDYCGRSLVNLIATLQELTALKVGFVFLTEALDLTTPTDQAFLGMFGGRRRVRARQSAPSSERRQFRNAFPPPLDPRDLP